MVEPLANAMHAVALASASPDSAVGVVGAGAIGALVAWVLARRGVSVVVAERDDERRSRAAKIAEGAFPSLVQTDLDVTFDAVGTAEARRTAVAALRPGGTSVWLGLAHHDPGFDAQVLVRSERRVLGSSCYREEDFRGAVQLASELPESWCRSVPLAEGASAFRSLLTDRSGPMRTLLIPGGEKASR